ncbi:MAG: glycosyltransferase family 4 protein, partial [Microbacteriaceae bacterium]
MVQNIEVIVRKKLLVLAFSNISLDARVLRQVRTFSSSFDVITCGYGPAPDGVSRHIEIPKLPSLPKYLGYILVDLHFYFFYYWMLPRTRYLKKILSNIHFDVIIANDTFAIPIATSLKSRAGVLADLHEYFPLYREHEPIWLKREAPFHRWICRRYVSRAKVVTTVNETLASKYQDQFGFITQVVTNATPYADLKPGKINDTLKIVHSGGASKGRNLEVMIEAVQKASLVRPMIF